MTWLDRIHVGDCRAIMRQMIAAGVRVNCIVTSPPYWGLRDYGTARWSGGAADCSHTSTRRGHGEDEKQSTSAGTSRDRISGSACRLCGARRVDSQLGLERTPIRYVARMRSVMRLARELLADDGVMWLNLGDCYATGAGKVGDHPSGGEQGARWRGDVDRIRDEKRARGRPPRGATSTAGYRGAKFSTNTVDPKGRAGLGPMTQPNRMPIRGLKPKDLVGIPWRVALTLQADGWWLRSDVIWSKPNPMPESVTDRPTKSHEYVFLMTRSERYHYDAAAIAESATARPPGNTKPTKSGREYESGDERLRTSANLHKIDARETRNARSVWTIPTTPFTGAHFATFPRDLVRRCILAGSRPGDTVFDPFMVSGTVAEVAISLGRRFIGCELNPAYAALFSTHRSQQMGMVV
jgi:DNA modification methylase